jgi:small subunit ribosomal protein S17
MEELYRQGTEYMKMLKVEEAKEKTIVVGVVRFAKDQRYQRVIKRFNKFKVHDEKNEAKVNDKVLIAETRPISKDKRWRLVKILK